jgi:hypothetical protein
MVQQVLPAVRKLWLWLVFIGMVGLCITMAITAKNGYAQLGFAICVPALVPAMYVRLHLAAPEAKTVFLVAMAGTLIAFTGLLFIAVGVLEMTQH